MAYSESVGKRVARRYEEKRERAISQSEERRSKLHELYPDLKEIDTLLSGTGLEIMKQASLGSDGLEERIDKLRRENLRLRQLRERLLVGKGYPVDYTSPKFECSLCSDTGYVGLNICQCMKKALSAESFLSSGLGSISDGQSFESFDVSLYSDKPEKGGQSSRYRMEQVLQVCRDYACSFGADGSSLLFVGGTGAGKTHLSSSIAKKVIEEGYDVVYDSAQTILYNFEKQRFERGGDEERTKRYFDCDLLIIDDLGTEYSGNMSLSSLYNIINTRVMSRRSMIISTNLSAQEIKKKYDDRIISRLFGQFRLLQFSSEDIRLKRAGIQL